MIKVECVTKSPAGKIWTSGEELIETESGTLWHLILVIKSGFLSLKVSEVLLFLSEKYSCDYIICSLCMSLCINVCAVCQVIWDNGEPTAATPTQHNTRSKCLLNSFFSLCQNTVKETQYYHLRTHAHTEKYARTPSRWENLEADPRWMLQTQMCVSVPVGGET